MASLSTGYVIVGAYAKKLRRTLFAQLKDSVKNGAVSNQEVARAAAEMNQLLYHILVEDLGLDKGDVVRVRVEYEVADGQVKWKLDTLSIEAFRRLPDEQVNEAVKNRVAA